MSESGWYKEKEYGIILIVDRDYSSYETPAIRNAIYHTGLRYNIWL